MSDLVIVGFAYLAGLLLLAACGIHIASVLLILAFAGAIWLLGWPTVFSFGEIAWSNLNNFLLTAIPMFILLGEIMLRSGVSQRMYRALSVWLSPIPGGLLHTNIGASALFSASSGSSVATAATIGTVALPDLEKRGYNEKLVLGSLAAGGTLGILIPPSINLVLYGAITNTSIGQLFLAGILPGITLAICFSLLILVSSFFTADEVASEDRPSLRERLRMSVDLVPPVILFIAVMGGIYSGLATPTEAASLGVIAAVGTAAYYRTLSLSMLHAAFRSTLKTTAMLLLIIVAAFFLNFVLSLVGLPQAMAEWITGLGFSPILTIWLLLALYVILGCFLETLSMMITTIPITTPMVVELGLSPVWFGVFIVIVCELALITPPVGMNLYVIQGIRKPGSRIDDVIIGASPFVGVILLMIVALMYFPDMALWLPGVLY